MFPHNNRNDKARRTCFRDFRKCIKNLKIKSLICIYNLLSKASVNEHIQPMIVILKCLNSTWLTFGRRAARSSCSGGVAWWGRSEPSSRSSCRPPRPSPSGRPPNGPAGRSPTSWTPDRDRRPPGSYCGPWREDGRGRRRIQQGRLF